MVRTPPALSVLSLLLAAVLHRRVSLLSLLLTMTTPPFGYSSSCVFLLHRWVPLLSLLMLQLREAVAHASAVCSARLLAALYARRLSLHNLLK